MQTLKILSDIWKSGAEMNLNPDGQIELKNHQLVPTETMKAAESIFPEIEKWFRSWQGASSVEITLQKILHQFCGWQHNEKLNEWLCSEIDSLLLFDEWMISLTRNGWNDMYDDYRKFENNESKVIAQEVYRLACVYTKRK
ncbi:hypothetical protein MKZ08_08345 [Viridibacillus sp. FSL R5-0477]|uniref:Uncharacterized protein n=1 Tax=Viridibacillus arenosi FSL R5-213 TaxID=1227360 RepID=W4EUJ7_9BACL|nr:hypothetical protein [Viridibacillus arenosi]ETT84198.1 hypothetical protein C176_12558 [Viridibacillus arenosi FSL R5-213]OMC90009.1 hypothetical protein BK137_14770 [Viridibacillus arenosi]